jgi:hypothetical protein
MTEKLAVVAGLRVVEDGLLLVMHFSGRSCG